MSRPSISRLLFLAALGVPPGCSPDVAPPDDQAVSPGTALLHAVDACLLLVDRADMQAAHKAVMDLLVSRPQVVAAGLSEHHRCAWGRLSDGTMIIVRAGAGEPSAVMAARPGRSSLSVPATGDAPQKTAGLRKPSSAGQRTEMPTGSIRLAGCYSTINTWDLVADALYHSHYPVPAFPMLSPGEGGTIESLLDARDIGILYMRTLGGGARPADEAGEIFSLMTSTDVTVTSEKNYQGLLRDGSLTLMNMPDGNGGRLHRFGITPRFIREHVRFSPDSLVYLDAGNSFDEGMRQAFLDQGASVYLGWTGFPGDTVALEAAHGMFRGMCLDHGQIGDSPNRPFDYLSVYAFLSRQGKTVDAQPLTQGSTPGTDTRDGPAARLQVAEGPGNFSILTPSIAWLKVDENPADPAIRGAVLHIHGSFGAFPGPGLGRVMIRQAESAAPLESSLRILNWQPSWISCELPAGPEHHGYVVVSAREQVSNSVPLTEWYLPIHVYHRTSEGLVDEARLTIHLRFDVHGHRRYYGEDPYPPTPPLSEYDTANGLAADSHGFWTSGGLAIIAVSWVAWSGGGPLHYRLTGDGSSILGQAGLWYDQTLWPANPRPPLHIRLTLGLSISGKTQSWGDWDSLNGYGPPKETYPWPFVTQANWQYLDLELDEAFNIKGGESGPISWMTTEPLYPPVSTTMR